jgi:hypothetical protein
MPQLSIKGGNMNGTRLICAAAMLGGAMIIAGCEKESETTPSGAAAPVPQASEQAADDMKAKTEDASERAKAAADKAGDSTAKTAEQASDAIKKNADATADAVAANPAAADATAKLAQVQTYMTAKNWEMAESTLKAVEANKASLPTQVQTQVTNVRTMLDAAKKGLATTSPAAVPK